MTRAMKISAMPTIGVVSRLVRRRASVSCSVAERGAQRGALGGERARHRRALGRARAQRSAAICSSSSRPSSTPARSQRVGEALAARGRLAHAAAQLGEQAAVTGARRLFERTLVPGVAGEQHRDQVEVGRHLVAQVAAHRPAPARRWRCAPRAGRATANSRPASSGTYQPKPMTPARWSTATTTVGTTNPASAAAARGTARAARPAGRRAGAGSRTGSRLEPLPSISTSWSDNRPAAVLRRCRRARADRRGRPPRRGRDAAGAGGCATATAPVAATRRRRGRCRRRRASASTTSAPMVLIATTASRRGGRSRREEPDRARERGEPLHTHDQRRVAGERDGEEHLTADRVVRVEVLAAAEHEQADARARP